jgi:hypothetical protein
MRNLLSSSSSLLSEKGRFEVELLMLVLDGSMCAKSPLSRNKRHQEKESVNVNLRIIVIVRDHPFVIMFSVPPAYPFDSRKSRALNRYMGNRGTDKMLHPDRPSNSMHTSAATPCLSCVCSTNVANNWNQSGRAPVWSDEERDDLNESLWL